LKLLGGLATYELPEAFLDLRGNPLELFTKLPDGTFMKSMRFAIEMLLDRHVRNDAGQKVELRYTRLRYELEVTFDDDELHVSHEVLKTIPSESDAWVKKYNVPLELLPALSINNRATLIEMGEHLRAINGPEYLPVGEPIVTVYREDQFQGNTLQYRVRDLPRTVLSLVIGTDYLPISVVRQEMQAWSFVHLDPDELRKSSSIGGPRLLSPQGGNLPTVLARMQREDEIALASVSRDVAYLVPEIYKVEVTKNLASAKYDLSVETRDHRTFSASVLSDGTLRLLALATLKNDLRLRRVLCLEEPENGVNPLTLEKVARLLRILATDFRDAEQDNEPLTQVIVTTQSPLFASQPEVKRALLFAYTVTRISPRSLKNISLDITSMVPVVTLDEIAAFAENEPVSSAVYTIDQVIEYLTGDTLSTTREELKEARKALNER